jgi:exopolysaccharide production protein ExoY
MYSTRVIESAKPGWGRHLGDEIKTLEPLSHLVDLGLIAAALYVTLYVFTGQLLLPGVNWFGASRWSALTGRSSDFILLLLISFMVWLAVSRLGGIYESHRGERLNFTTGLYLKWDFLWVLSLSFLAFNLKIGASSAFEARFFLLSFGLLIGKQLSFLAILRYVRGRGFDLKRVLVCGEREASLRFVQLLQREQSRGYQVVRVITEDLDGEDSVRLCRLESDDVVEAFIVGATANAGTLASTLLKAGKTVHILPAVFDVPYFRRGFTDFAGIPAISLGGKSLNSVQSLSKRLLDVTVAGIALAISFPIFAVVALLIKMTSPGPIFFRQERLGAGGKRFYVRKFRTMRKDAEHILRSDKELYAKFVEHDFKLPEEADFRITPVGRFLRKTSLDELPQLLNVLMGNMSLVGPRPIEPPHIEKYGDYADLFLSVKPGLTGTWQINGRGSVSHSRRIVMELEYIRDQSFLSDVDILIKTIPAVLSRKGAF